MPDEMCEDLDALVLAKCERLPHWYSEHFCERPEHKRFVQIAGDTALRDRMGAAAREFAQSVTWEDAARLTGEYIGKIISLGEKRS